MNYFMRTAFCSILFLTSVQAEEKKGSFVLTTILASADATQAACADEKFVYAVSNTRVVKYDRATGKEIAKSEGEAFHLNSGLIHDGKVCCAHSFYPKKPDDSDIRVCDPATMKLTILHAFKNPPGSLTWALPKGKEWWCCFAHYGATNGQTVLVRYDQDWKELGRWTFPPKLVEDWERSSLSGGIWDGETLLATGHDKKVIYRLRVPAKGEVIEWLATYDSPFPGQGIASDPKTGGLVGIHRGEKKVVFAKFEK